MARYKVDDKVGWNARRTKLLNGTFKPLHHKAVIKSIDRKEGLMMVVLTAKTAPSYGGTCVAVRRINGRWLAMRSSHGYEHRIYRR